MSALILAPGDRVATLSGPRVAGTILGAEMNESERYVVEWDDGLVTGIHVYNLEKLVGSNGIAGPCVCPLGKHHAPGCPNYIEVWRSCPCPECSARRR